MSDRYERSQRAAEVRKKMLGKAVDAVSNAGLSFDESERTLVFYAARFMKRPDKANDIIAPTAFDNWYRRWKSDPKAMYPATDGKLMVVVSHEYKSFGNVIGWASPEDVTIDSRGLLVAAHLFATDEARKTWEVARDLGVGASFAYSVARKGEHRDPKTGFNILTEFDEIMEVGPTPLGCEPEAGSVAVKDMDRVIIEFKSLDADLRKRGLLGATLVELQDEYDAVLAKMRARGLSTKDLDVDDVDDDILGGGDEDLPERCADCGAFTTGSPITVSDGAGNTVRSHVVACARCGAVSMKSRDVEGVRQAVIDDNVRWVLNYAFPDVWSPVGKKWRDIRTDNSDIVAALKGRVPRSYIPTVFPRKTREDFKREQAIMLQRRARAELAELEAAIGDRPTVKSRAQRELELLELEAAL